MASQRDYTKDIIEEYNIRLKSWGNSSSWGLTEFKMLEDLIYESSKMRINANTLKRFFQQKTSNPQLATNNALCIFLGYSGYAEFVMKKTQQTTIQDEAENDKPNSNSIKEETKLPVAGSNPDASNNLIKETEQKKDRSRRRYSSKGIYSLIIIIGIICFFVVSYWDNIKAKYENHFISSVVFKSSLTKGASPFTIKVEYDIPEQLFDSISIVCVEANGDITTRKLKEGQHEIYATFIYPGKGVCQLRYKNKVIRSIDVESRTIGWSAYLKEDRSGLYQALPFSSVSTENGYLTLPLDKVPQDARTDKLFVSYTYYTDSIIDGDNFIFEARVRNSKEEDNGIPLYDIMMYIFSNTGFHGFTLNEKGDSFMKFISSENSITGDQHDFSHLNINPNLWHIMQIEVIDKNTTFYLDGQVVLKTNYSISLGAANELTFRFKGCGAVDYVKVMNLDKQVVYENNFDNKGQL